MSYLPTRLCLDHYLSNSPCPKVQTKCPVYKQLLDPHSQSAPRKQLAEVGSRFWPLTHTLFNHIKATIVSGTFYWAVCASFNKLQDIKFLCSQALGRVVSSVYLWILMASLYLYKEISFRPGN